MRQLKTFMRNRKEDILGCGDCSCYTLQCWRNSDVNCGCGGGAVQELEIMPVPDTPGMFSIHMPDNGNWVIGEDGALVIGNMDKTTDSVFFGFGISDQNPEGGEIWKHIVNEEVYNSIISTLENLPQEGGKLSAKDSKVILDAYNDLIKTTIVLKNPRMETIDDAAYYLMDLYDYKTNALIRTYEFDFYSLQSKNNIYLSEAWLMNVDDMGDYIYELVDYGNNYSWVEGASVDGEVVYLAYEYSKSFRNVLSLTGLRAPVYISEEGVGTEFYQVSLGADMIEIWPLMPLYNHIFYTNDGIESWEALADDTTGEVLRVTKGQDDTFTFTIEGTGGDLDAVVAVLEGLRTEVQGAIFYQCTEPEYTWTDNARNILWEVYLTPTQAKINEAITKMEQLFVNEGRGFTYCGR